MHRLELTPEENAVLSPMLAQLAKAHDTIEDLKLIRRAPVFARDLPIHLLEFLEEFLRHEILRTTFPDVDGEKPASAPTPTRTCRSRSWSSACGRLAT